MGWSGADWSGSVDEKRVVHGKPEQVEPRLCPQCKKNGIVEPRGGKPYCEDCGWPDEDYGSETKDALREIDEQVADAVTRMIAQGRENTRLKSEVKQLRALCREAAVILRECNFDAAFYQTLDRLKAAGEE